MFLFYEYLRIYVEFSVADVVRCRPPEVFYRSIVVQWESLKFLQILQENIFAGASFLTKKVSSPQRSTPLKETLTQTFSYELCKFFWNIFFGDRR